jgi:hypothetical protein
VQFSCTSAPQPRSGLTKYLSVTAFICVLWQTSSLKSVHCHQLSIVCH